MGQGGGADGGWKAFSKPGPVGEPFSGVALGGSAGSCHLPLWTLSPTPFFPAVLRPRPQPLSHPVLQLQPAWSLNPAVISVQSSFLKLSAVSTLMEPPCPLGGRLMEQLESHQPPGPRQAWQPPQPPVPARCSPKVHPGLRNGPKTCERD